MVVDFFHRIKGSTLLLNIHPFLIPKRFYPGPLKPDSLAIQKVIRRIIYPFYNNPIYKKSFLPAQEVISTNLVQWAHVFDNKRLLLDNIRNIWTNNYVYNETLKNIHQLHLKESLSSFYNAIKYNKLSIINNISGIWQPSSEFIKNDPYIAEFLIKVIVNLFNGKSLLLNEDLILRIHDALSPVNWLDNVYYYPALQHTLNSILVSNKFSIEAISKINHNIIDYTFHKIGSASVQLIIESKVISYSLNNYLVLNKNDRKFIFQNPDNPLGDHALYSNLCYNQMKQPHGDIREDNLLLQKSKFFDVKLMGNPLKKLALSKGHLSLTTTLNDKNKLDLMQRSYSDYKGLLSQRAQNNIITEEDYIYGMSAIKPMINIIKNKQMSVIDKYEKFITIQNELNIDPQMQFVCSYIVKIPDNSDYIKIYDTYLKNDVDRNTIIKEIMSVKHKLFPNQGQYVDRIAWDKIIKVIIKSLPKNIATTVEENYLRVKLLEL